MALCCITCVVSAVVRLLHFSASLCFRFLTACWLVSIDFYTLQCLKLQQLRWHVCNKSNKSSRSVFSLTFSVLLFAHVFLSFVVVCLSTVVLCSCLSFSFVVCFLLLLCRVALRLCVCVMCVIGVLLCDWCCVVVCV